MTSQRDPETILAAWLDEGPTDLPDATRRAIVTALPTTVQARRGLFAPWRFGPMHVPMRLAAPALVALTVVVLGVVLGVGSPRPRPTAGPPVHPSPTAPAPTASLVAQACGHQLVPTLLLSVGCTYDSTVFAHPLTVTLADPWLSGDERATAVSFRGYGPSISGAEVRLIILGDVSDGGCIGFTTPPPSPQLPRTAAEYIAWLRLVAPSAIGPVGATVGGLPATAFTIPNPDAIANCTALRLGSTSLATDPARTSLDCFGGDCTLYVIDDGSRVLLLQATLRPYIEPSDPQAAERFLGGLRFAP